MMNTRRLAIAAGVLYLITHVTSVAAVALYPPLKEANFMAGSGADSGVILGALFDVIMALAVVGSAVALYPVVKRKAPSLALGVFGLRTLEAAMITVGVVSVLTAVNLHQNALAGGDTTSLLTAHQTLVGIYDWAFVVGPNLVLATSTMMLAYVMFRSQLVPRWIGFLGLVGAPIVFGRAVGTLFGLFEHGFQVSVWGAILTIPIFAWELSLAFRLIFKDFNEKVLAESNDKETADLGREDALVEAIG
jgi:hypothetical protein